MLPKVLAVEEATSNKRIFGFDLTSAAAIGLVLIAHGFKQLNPFIDNNMYTHFAGVLGLELFFELSGFLLGIPSAFLGCADVEKLFLYTVYYLPGPILHPGLLDHYFYSIYHGV